jgi:hypothetical protein
MILARFENLFENDQDLIIYLLSHWRLLLVLNRVVCY